MKTPIIFLDIDGVLNSHTFYAARVLMDRSLFNDIEGKFDFNLYELDITPLALLSQLVVKTEANIVISSTWRLGRDVKDFQPLFKQRGVEFDPSHFIGQTPQLEGIRGLEIESWIKTYHFEGNYVILDDDSDMLAGQPLVQCKYSTGFTFKEYQECLEILNVK